MQVLRAVVGTEFTEGFRHIVSHSCVSYRMELSTRTTAPSLCVQEQGSAHSSEHPWLFPLSFMSYLWGKGALSSEWRKARPQQGRRRLRKPGCHSGPADAGREALPGCEQEGLSPELQYSILTCHMAQHFLINRGHFSLGTAPCVQHWIIRSKKNPAE